MAVVPTNFRAIHDHDVHWILELWLRIHGGDPSPLKVSAAAADIIKGLAVHLPPEKAKGVTAALH